MSDPPNKSGNQICPCGSGRKFRYCHGKGLPALENIATISIDRERKQRIIVTKDLLVNQLNRDGPAIARSFDALAKHDIVEISEVIARAMSLMFRHVDLVGEGYEATCASLLFSASSTFTASIEVARHGYRRPYGAIARGIVETLSTVVHISTEAGALALLHEGKLKSTKSITVAARAFPPFGPLYGMLSNHFVHINKSHATFEPTVKYAERDEAFEFIISTLRTHAWLIYVIAELAFNSDLAEPRYWKPTGEHRLDYAPSDDERAWMARFLGRDTMSG